MRKPEGHEPLTADFKLSQNVPDLVTRKFREQLHCPGRMPVNTPRKPAQLVAKNTGWLPFRTSNSMVRGFKTSIFTNKKKRRVSCLRSHAMRRLSNAYKSTHWQDILDQLVRMKTYLPIHAANVHWSPSFCFHYDRCAARRGFIYVLEEHQPP